MNMNLHATGASFIAMATDHNPRDIVVELVKKHPHTDRKTLFEEFRRNLEEMGDDYRRAVEWYFFVNMHDYLTTTRNHKGPMLTEAVAQREDRRVQQVKAQIVMLDLTMPNGKAMRDCTGAEMARFGNRYQRIAEKVGKGKLVGAVLNEEQVQAIMK